MDRVTLVLHGHDVYILIENHIDELGNGMLSRGMYVAGVFWIKKTHLLIVHFKTINSYIYIFMATV